MLWAFHYSLKNKMVKNIAKSECTFQITHICKNCAHAFVYTENLSLCTPDLSLLNYLIII